MKLKNEIMTNKFGQGIITLEQILQDINSNEEKRSFLNELIFLIIQSKPDSEDIKNAIVESKLKESFTPCVILKKGLDESNLNKIINLPDKELNKSFILLLSLFKVAYNKRFIIEKNNPNKWWYWDLSSEEVINKILNKYE